MRGTSAELQWHDPVVDGERPHERESALAQGTDARVRALVLPTFPISVVLLWPLVGEQARPLFLGAVAWIVLANVAGYLVPWSRFPRWLEMAAPLSTIVALTLLVAPVGGMAHGYAIILVVPVLWLAIFADPPDIAVGLLLTAACLLAPIDSWIGYLPEQGSWRQDLYFLVVLSVFVIGVRPVISPLRDQIGRTRRAVDALHASQATLAHDLRNPLAAIRSLAMLTKQRLELAPDDPATPGKLREYADVILASTDRAEQVIEGVLELSRAGDQLPWVDTIDLPALVHEVAAGVPGVVVRARDAPRTIVGHRPSIARLVANLLENAAMHAGDGEAGERRDVTVSVAGRELPAGWLLTVTDDGRGFEDGAAAMLFEPWRRGTDAGATGSGLGLAIVAGIVEQHGGTISASNAKPSGASFTFTLSRRPSVAADPGAG